VVQVHMIFKHDFTDPWEYDEVRTSKLVFIGKNLDATAHVATARTREQPATVA
jgi:hypothetical protein